MKMIQWEAEGSSAKELLFSRGDSSQESIHINNSVQAILAEVKEKGDEALKHYTHLFDKVLVKDFAQGVLDWDENKISLSDRKAIDEAYQNIYRLHVLDKPKGFSEASQGIEIEKIYRPINRVGLYIPGGSAPLVSSVLMLGVPAQIAGCQQVVMITPPNLKGEIQPAIFYAAAKCGIRTLFSIGGAHGIAALAYGTESIPKVDKIFGPGNRYVMEAKNQVSKDRNGASIDMPAGPSEVMIIADNDASPTFVAADLLAQGEHDMDAKCVLLTTSQPFAAQVFDEVLRQKSLLQRKTQLEGSLKGCLLIVVSDLKNCFSIANDYAPEHLILHLNNPRQYVDQIQTAGSVFLGPWTPEAFGDYASGTNHVLPTMGYAKTYSGLGVNQFMTSFTIQEASRLGFLTLAPTVERLAALETLDAHQQSVILRRQQIERETS